MLLFVLGLLLFLGVHLLRVVAPSWRLAMIERFGPQVWRLFYSGTSLAGLAVLVLGYRQAPVIDLWFPPMGMSHLVTTLMLVASIVLVASQLPYGHIATRTRHPMVLAVKIWAASHLLANGDLRSMLLFVTFLAWGVLLRINYKRRERAGDLVPRPFVSARYDVLAVVGGICLWAVITFWLHELILGVAPITM